MTRNLKALGLALVAVFALSAVAASAASADALTAEAAPVTLTGIQDPGTTDLFTTTSGAAKCTTATYVATQTTTSATTVTITPSYGGANDDCTAFGVLPSIIDVNGCDYLFHINTGTLTTGTVDIECPAGKEITITVNENTANTLTTKCVIHIPPQVGINNITYKFVGAGATREITVEINSNNIHYTHTAGTGLGACAGGSAVNGKYEGKATITAETEPGGSHVGIFLSNL